MSPPYAVRGEAPRRMASCVDVPRWASFRGHTCADYLAFNWCADGRVLSASATGAIFGRPVGVLHGGAVRHGARRAR